MKPNFFSILLLTSAALAISGCGNLAAPKVTKASADTAYPGNLPTLARGAGSSLLDADGYSCPTAPNVVPDYDYDFNGTGFYSVCANREQTETAKIHGTSATSAICVFPVEIVDESHIYWKPDLSTGGPLSTCYNLAGASNGVLAAFSGVKFNAMFIVEKDAVENMRSCLIGGNYSACPHYSYGRFR